MTGRMPWGLELPLRPFFGVMAVAPPLAWGSVSTLPPRKNGGNLDNKELVAGTTLYLPIHVDDALFSVGDGHGVQGDGEVCVTAIETGLIGTFELLVREDMQLEWPRAETPTHVMTMAFDPDLDDCVVIALRQMVDLVAKAAGIKSQEAYALCSLAADVRITQVVNGSKGVHVMLDKRYLARGGAIVGKGRPQARATGRSCCCGGRPGRNGNGRGAPRWPRGPARCRTRRRRPCAAGAGTGPPCFWQRPRGPGREALG